VILTWDNVREYKNVVVFTGEVPQDTKEWANSEGSAELDERSGEDSEEEGGRSRHESQQALKVPQNNSQCCGSPKHRSVSAPYLFRI